MVDTKEKRRLMMILPRQCGKRRLMALEANRLFGTPIPEDMKKLMKD